MGKIIIRLCEVDGCQERHKARGLCVTHYRRARNSGELVAQKGQGRRPFTLEEFTERFWAQVDTTGTCWIWLGPQNMDGYGKTTSRLDATGRGKSVTAHRLAYQLTYGEVAADKQIDHRCHNRLCVNPEHLRSVTHKQNMENLSGARRGSRSGVRGVGWLKSRGKWTASVRHNSRVVFVGYFSTVGEAEAAAIAKRNELFTHNDADRVVSA